MIGRLSRTLVLLLSLPTTSAFLVGLGDSLARCSHAQRGNRCVMARGSPHGPEGRAVLMTLSSAAAPSIEPPLDANALINVTAAPSEEVNKEAAMWKQPIGRREAALSLTAAVEAVRRVQGGRDAVDGAEELRPFYELAQRCRRSGMPDMVLEVLNTYRRVASAAPHANATSDLWTLTISAHAELGDVALAARTMEETLCTGRMILLRGCRTSSWRIGRILEALVSSSRAGLIIGLDLKQQLEEVGLHPDYSFYPAALEALWRWGPFIEDDAMSDGDYVSELATVTLFPQRHPSIDNKNTTAVQDITATLLSPSRSRKLVQDMYSEVERMGFKLNSGLKSSLIRCIYRSTVALNASKVGTEWMTERETRMEGAMRAARDAMTYYNISWTTAIANGLLQECLRVNHTEGASFVMKMMVRSNVTADLSTFNGLLHVYSEAGDAATCVSLMQAMKETKLAKPNGLTYALIAEAFLNAQQQQQQQMGAGNHSAADGADNAGRYLTEAARVGLPPCPDLWRARLRHHVLTSSTSGPLEPLLREADSAAFPISATLLSSLLDTYAQAAGGGNLEQAVHLFSSLRWPKFNVPADHISLVLPPPTRAVYTAMITSFCLHDRWQVALSLLKRMQSRAQPFLLPWQMEAMTPSRHGYTTIIKSAVDAGNMQAALQVVKFMESQGVCPSQAALTHLIRGFGNEKDVNAAMGVWLELRGAYHPPCRAAFEAMVSACVTHPSGLEPALRVLADMRQSAGYDLDRQYYRPFMDSVGYDAIHMQRILEPFRQKVGLIEVDDEALAALMFACMRNGMTMEQSAARLCALGVGLPAMTMIYLRLDRPVKSAMVMERKAVVANYELRATMGELGWLSMDSEYDQPGLASARYEEFTRHLTATLRTLKEQQGMALAAARSKKAAAAAGGGGGGGGEKAVGVAGVGKMAAKNKADRREAQTSRRERQLQKFKEKGAPAALSSSSSPRSAAAGAGQGGGKAATVGPAPAAAAVVRDQRNQARKLLGGTTTSPPPPSPAKKSSSSSSSGSKPVTTTGGAASEGGAASVIPLRGARPPPDAPKRTPRKPE